MTRRHGRYGRKFNRARMSLPKRRALPKRHAAPAWLTMCAKIWNTRPKHFPSNPSPYRWYRQANPLQKLSDWLTNVVYWTHKPKSYPIKIGPADKAAANLWLSINKCVLQHKP